MAETEPDKSTKRRLRAPGPSIREKAEKAQIQADLPVKERRLKTAGKAAGKPFRGVGKLFDRQPFRLIGRILWPKFVRNTFGELKYVEWPNRRQTIRLTYAVLTFAVIFCVLVGLVDYGLDKLFRTVLLK